MEKILKIQEINGEWGGYEIVTDKQNVTLLIDNDQSCCEDWGWFWSNDNPQDFIGAELLGISITDTALRSEKVVDVHEGDTMFVNIETSNGLLQFVAYNAHNGYYGHIAKVSSTQLNYSTCL